MAFALDAHGDQRKGGDEGQLQGQATGPANFVIDRQGSDFRLFEPPRQMRRAGERAGDEGNQCHRHARAAATDSKERARGAATAQLHANAEDKRARHYRDADRRQGGPERLAKGAAGAEQWGEDHACHGEHDQLRPHTAAPAVADQASIGAGEAEQRVIEGDTERAADQVERALASAHTIAQIYRAAAQQQQCGNERQGLRLSRREPGYAVRHGNHGSNIGSTPGTCQ